MLLDLIADKMAIPQSVRNSPAERDMMKQEAMQMAQQAAQVNPEMAAQVAGEAMKGAM
jgi:ABC-type iron transport system FetAB ATPase subunit